MKKISLLEVAENVTQPPAPFDGMRKYVATADANGSELREGTLVTFRDRPSRANLVGSAGDILVAKMQATEKVIQLDGNAAKAVFSTGFFNLRPRSQALASRYLYWFLRSPYFQGEKDRRCTGATQKALTLSALSEIEIPLVGNVDEQHRIAAILDRADSIRHKRAVSLATADELLTSTFLDMFGDPLTNSKRLPVGPIHELARVVTGNTPPRNAPENYGPGIEWIKSDNINTPQVFLTPAVETLSDKGRQIARAVPTGATLVTCIAGSPNSIGNCAMADREVAFNQQINAAVPKPGIDPYFLYCQFRVGKRAVQAASTKSMKGMVSKGKFQEIKFINPSSATQKAFGRFAESIINSSKRFCFALSESQSLFESLSQRAFRGEL